MTQQRPRNKRGQFITQGRDDRGRYKTGPMSAETKAAISRAQIERHRRSHEQLGPPPDQKRCTQCKRMKPVPEGYSMRRRKLKSGEIRLYPAGECLECAAKRRAKWLATMTPEEVREINRKASAKYQEKNREEIRRRNRLNARMKRAEQGVKPRGPWLRYRSESAEKAPQYRVDAQLFLEWLTFHPGVVLTEAEARVVRRCMPTTDGRPPTQRNISFWTIESIMTRAGEPDQAFVLYPDPGVDSAQAA